MEKLKSNLPNMFISLVGICLVVSTILALLNDLTKGPIDEMSLKQKINAIKDVTPRFDNNPFQDRFKICVLGTTDSTTVYPAKLSDKIVGYAIDSYTELGFAGHISIMVGFDNNDNIIDYKILNMSETPGLGTKMVDFFKTEGTKGYIRNIKGLNMNNNSPLIVVKDGGQVDAISAATISSRAFLDAVNRAYSVYKQVKETNK